jgi:RNA polymerase sigma-70 factor (ECF subfamily)
MTIRIQEIEKMVLPFKDKLYRFALSIVGNTFEAEDVVQEVLIKVWKKKEDFIQIENKEAWCMTVTRNLAIDKRRSRRVIHDDITNHYELSDRNSNPAQITEFNDTMSRIKKIMDRLPEDQKEIIHLRDIEGCTYKEIAEITGITVERVKVNLHRARKALRSQIVNLRPSSY